MGSMSALPELRVVAIPMRTRFRGITVRRSSGFFRVANSGWWSG